ncbi:MAG: FliG C-terminal domain-containing protein [Yoonia sp.]|jgi:flagellar motor switch protein FliG|nr:FliG C-terminal domain-containing protein [Yoonia sp.]
MENLHVATTDLDQVSPETSAAMRTMSGQIREEADEQGPIKPKIAEEAMRDLSAAIRTLADKGAITMKTEEEDEDTLSWTHLANLPNICA